MAEEVIRCPIFQCLCTQLENGALGGAVGFTPLLLPSLSPQASFSLLSPLQALRDLLSVFMHCRYLRCTQHPPRITCLHGQSEVSARCNKWITQWSTCSLLVRTHQCVYWLYRAPLVFPSCLQFGRLQQWAWGSRFHGKQSALDMRCT